MLAWVEEAGCRLNLIILARTLHGPCGRPAWLESRTEKFDAAVAASAPQDACRSKPTRGRGLGGDRGLAKMEANRGNVIAFACAPGEVADDGAPRAPAQLRHDAPHGAKRCVVVTGGRPLGRLGFD